MDLTLRLAKGFVQTKLRELLGISPRLILECADTSALFSTRHVAALRRRRGILIEYPPQKSASSVGAAYSDDVAPERSLRTFDCMGYKDFAPTALAVLKIRLSIALKCASAGPAVARRICFILPGQAIQ
jgi:hypothetical protein